MLNFRGVLVFGGWRNKLAQRILAPKKFWWDYKQIFLWLPCVWVHLSKSSWEFETKYSGSYIANPNFMHYFFQGNPPNMCCLFDPPKNGTYFNDPWKNQHLRNGRNDFHGWTFSKSMPGSVLQARHWTAAIVVSLCNAAVPCVVVFQWRHDLQWGNTPPEI